MTEVAFYHMERSNLEGALPRLLEKALASGLRVVVKAGSEERVEALNAALWTYGQGSFLPHGSARDGNAADQPVWLTAGDDNPNGAKVLALVDGAASDQVGDFDRCLELFDGGDGSAVSAAREHWKEYKDSGYALTYWRQGGDGRWHKQDL